MSSIDTSKTQATTPTARTTHREAAAKTPTETRGSSVEAAPVPSQREVAAAAGRAAGSHRPAAGGAGATTQAGPTGPATAAGTLQNFNLSDLQQFTKNPIDPKADFVIFNVGTDNVHGVLNYLMSHASKSVDMNMYGYDDPQLNAQCMRCATDPKMSTHITLDKSQASGPHEKSILQADEAQNPAAFNKAFVIGESATDQISHTKGGVLDGKVGFEGSVNWSSSGEGTFVSGSNTAGGSGYKAQNNTLTVFTNPQQIADFQASLQTEHQTAIGQHNSLSNLPAAPPS